MACSKIKRACGATANAGAIDALWQELLESDDPTQSLKVCAILAIKPAGTAIFDWLPPRP